VNWSEVVRAAIKEKIREEESRREVDPADIEEALTLMDRVRRPQPGFDGTGDQEVAGPDKVALDASSVLKWFVEEPGSA
jgi:hypothetical protein